MSGWNQLKWCYPPRGDLTTTMELYGQNRPLVKYAVSFLEGDAYTDETIDDAIITNENDLISGCLNPVVFTLPMIQHKKKAGRYLSGAGRTYTLQQPIISGMISVKNGTREDAEALVKASKSSSVWIFLAGMYNRDYENALKLTGGDDVEMIRHGIPTDQLSALAKYNAATERLPFPFNAQAMQFNITLTNTFYGDSYATSAPRTHLSVPTIPLLYQQSAILTRDIMLVDRSFSKTLDGGHNATIRYSGVWSAHRRAQ